MGTVRRFLWPSLSGLMLIAAMTAVWPFWRLRIASEAARKEGLFLTSAEVAKSRPKLPPKENAMTLVLPLYERELSLQALRIRSGTNQALSYTIQGFAGTAERATARRYLLATKDLTRLWRIAASRIKLDTGTDWSDQNRIWKVVYLAYGRTRFLSCAALGIDPAPNLLAAARLSKLMRQEPGLISQAQGLRSTDDMLRIARRCGIERRVAEALGPPTDPKVIYQLELEELLTLIESVKRPEFQKKNFFKPSIEERIRQLAPFDAAARTRAIEAWRAAWKRLPTRIEDYGVASMEIDRTVGAMIGSLQGYSSYIDRWMANYRPGEILRTNAFLEADRQAALQGRPSPDVK